jgi:hypothetical protein
MNRGVVAAYPVEKFTCWEILKMPLFTALSAVLLNDGNLLGDDATLAWIV